MSLFATRPVEGHSGSPETIAGPITTSFRMGRDRDAEDVEREELWEGMPLNIRLGVRGASFVSSASRIRGGALAESAFYAYLRSERSYLEYAFQFFSARWRGPQTSRGPGNPPRINTNNTIIFFSLMSFAVIDALLTSVVVYLCIKCFCGG